MGAKHDLRRVGAASATVSAGAVMFFAFGTGPAAAQTGAAPAGSASLAGSDCKLGTLLCGILGGGGSSGTPSPAPTAGGGTSTAPKPKTGTKPKSPAPKAAPAPARHSGGSPSGGTAARSAVRPPSGVGGDAPAIPAPLDRPTPLLPDVTAPDPVVFPEAAQPGGGQVASARLVAAGEPQGDTIPPLLVATASGLAGAMAALNVSVLRRRIRDARGR